MNAQKTFAHESLFIEIIEISVYHIPLACLRPHYSLYKPSKMKALYTISSRIFFGTLRVLFGVNRDEPATESEHPNSKPDPMTDSRPESKPSGSRLMMITSNSSSGRFGHSRESPVPSEIIPGT